MPETDGGVLKRVRNGGRGDKRSSGLSPCPTRILGRWVCPRFVRSCHFRLPCAGFRRPAGHLVPGGRPTFVQFVPRIFCFGRAGQTFPCVDGAFGLTLCTQGDIDLVITGEFFVRVVHIEVKWHRGCAPARRGCRKNLRGCRCGRSGWWIQEATMWVNEACSSDILMRRAKLRAARSSFWAAI